MQIIIHTIPFMILRVNFCDRKSTFCKYHTISSSLIGKKSSEKLWACVLFQKLNDQCPEFTTYDVFVDLSCFCCCCWRWCCGCGCCWWLWIDDDILRPKQNGRHFPTDIFKRTFLNENVWLSTPANILITQRLFYLYGDDNTLTRVTSASFWS